MVMSTQDYTNHDLEVFQLGDWYLVITVRDHRLGGASDTVSAV